MPPRMVCNVVCAYLLGDAAPDDRDKFYAELYASSSKPVDLDRLAGEG